MDESQDEGLDEIDVMNQMDENNMPQTSRAKGLKFSIRSLLVAALIVGLACGWFSTLQRLHGLRRNYEQRLEYAEEELARSVGQLRDLRRGKQADKSRSFWEAELEGSDLSGMTFATDRNAFQRASFRSCNLERSVLKGGTSAFQSACFDGANLHGARLEGDGASFQGATFVKAELTGAKLIGGGGSFQMASFEEANMIDTIWSGNFQRVNLNGVRLHGADLSAIDPENLASCIFEIAPVYDSKTRFPKGFNPSDHFWRAAE